MLPGHGSASSLRSRVALACPCRRRVAGPPLPRRHCAPASPLCSRVATVLPCRHYVPPLPIDFPVRGSADAHHDLRVGIVELGALLEWQHGVVSRRQAMRYVSAKIVERRVASGRWQAPHRAVYVTHSGPIDRRQFRWIAALAAGAGRVALLGGLSALETLGFRGFSEPGIHVLLPARMRIRSLPIGIQVHRTSCLPAADIHRLGNPPGTIPARSLIDAAQWAGSDDRARAIVASGFQQRLVDADHMNLVLTRIHG
jgi:hypothetical protein